MDKTLDTDQGIALVNNYYKANLKGQDPDKWPDQNEWPDIGTKYTIRRYNTGGIEPIIFDMLTTEKPLKCGLFSGTRFHLYTYSNNLDLDREILEQNKEGIANGKSIDLDLACRACDETGLYQGMAERDSSAVVCSRCKGSGMEHFFMEYKEFTGRKPRKGVARVYQTSAGYGISARSASGIRFHEAGVSYEEWLKGKPPLPIKDLHCPLQHYGQGNPDVKVESICDCAVVCGRYISDCPRRKNPGIEKCWEKMRQKEEDEAKCGTH